MQTENIFSPTRMQSYLRKHFTDHYRFYILGMLTVFLVMICIPLFMVTFGGRIQRLTNIMPIYYIGLFLGGTWLTSRSFSELSGKESGMDFLMIPASRFEKFLTFFLISLVGYFVFFHICWYAAVQVANLADVRIYKEPMDMDFSLFSDPDEKIYVYYGYLLLQAIFLLGATYYHKYTFAKTLLTLVVFLVALAALNSLFVTCLFGANSGTWKQTIPFLMISKLEGGPVYWHQTAYVIPEWLQHTYLFIFRFLLAPVLWLIAYVRFKDQEI